LSLIGERKIQKEIKKMTEYNDYETKGIGFYGNGTETFFINKNGVCFVIQSPDLVDVADAVKVNNFLPVDAVQLGTADVDGIEVPEWCYEAR
jgi:hypothetical protein